jgi:hypothetical protein
MSDTYDPESFEYDNLIVPTTTATTLVNTATPSCESPKYWEIEPERREAQDVRSISSPIGSRHTSPVPMEHSTTAAGFVSIYPQQPGQIQYTNQPPPPPNYPPPVPQQPTSYPLQPFQMSPFPAPLQQPQSLVRNNNNNNIHPERMNAYDDHHTESQFSQRRNNNNNNNDSQDRRFDERRRYDSRDQPPPPRERYDSRDHHNPREHRSRQRSPSPPIHYRRNETQQYQQPIQQQQSISHPVTFISPVQQQKPIPPPITTIPEIIPDLKVVQSPPVILNPGCFEYSMNTPQKPVILNPGCFEYHTAPQRTRPSTLQASQPIIATSFDTEPKLHYSCSKCGSAWLSRNLDQNRTQVCRYVVDRSNGSICGQRNWSIESLQSQHRRIDINRSVNTLGWMRAQPNTSMFNPFATPAGSVSARV